MSHIEVHRNPKSNLKAETNRNRNTSPSKQVSLHTVKLTLLREWRRKWYIAQN